MYNLTIHFGPNAVAWSFFFKEKDKAETARQSADVAMCEHGQVFIEDEFGQRGSMANISGVLLEDTDLGTEARILRGIDNAIGQARANKRAQANPELRSLQQSQGPGVLTPFANGGFRQ